MADTPPAPLAYLATPYKLFKPNLDAAARAAAMLAARLIRAGVHVYAPIVHSHMMATWSALDHNDMTVWGPLNAIMMARADTLIVAHLDGWAESAGIAAEIAAFEAAGKPIYDLDPATLVMTRRESVRQQRDKARAAKDEAYRQRNHLAAALATLFPSGTRRTAIPGWSDDWHGCVYIDLPTGQISYHYHDSHALLFAGLPAYDKPYDGHDKDAVHVRLARLQRRWHAAAGPAS